LLEVEELSVAYGDVRALWDVSLEVEEGSIVALVGANGAGKTTLLKAISGLLRPAGGRIMFEGEDLVHLNTQRRVDKGIVMVPEGRRLFQTLTVLENLRLGAYLPKARAGYGDSLERVFSLFPVLLEMKGRRGGNLSGGQQQQLAVARALAARPKVLLLDEPTEGIQPSIIRDMGRTLKRIRDERGLSIVVSEQVLSFALDVADRVLVIENGRIVHESPRATIDEAKVSKFLSV